MNQPTRARPQKPQPQKRQAAPAKASGGTAGILDAVLGILGFKSSKPPPKQAVPTARQSSPERLALPSAPAAQAATEEIAPDAVDELKSSEASEVANPADDPALQRGVGAVMIRNEFYRDGYRTMQRIALIQMVAIIGLIGAMMYIIHVHQPENRYFATTEDGRLIPLVSLNEPNLSTPALLSWVAQAATETMTFGFHDYRRRLQESARFFTRPGWEGFINALQKSGVLETVESARQIVTAAPTSAPIIVSEGIVNDRYQWIVQLPLSVTYQAGSRSRSDNLLVNLVIVRVPRLESLNGVGIEQWIAVQN